MSTTTHTLSSSAFVAEETRGILKRLGEIAAQLPPPAEKITHQEMRRRANAIFAAWNVDLPPLAEVSDRTVPGPGGPLKIRLYNPARATATPLLLYLHGGGWMIGDLDLEDRALRLLALESGIRIASLDYRLAPEHPFPAAIEDCMAVYLWLLNHAEEWGGRRNRIALGGASAGANIALATALKLRDTDAPLPAFLSLCYGVYGADRNTPSDAQFGHTEFAGALIHMEMFYGLYAGSPEHRRSPLVAPLLADLHGLPPVHMNAAGLDPLRDDSRLLCAKLRDSGVPVSFVEYPGVIHGFTQFSLTSEIARAALRDSGIALREALSD